MKYLVTDDPEFYEKFHEEKNPFVSILECNADSHEDAAKKYVVDHRDRYGDDILLEENMECFVKAENEQEWKKYIVTVELNCSCHYG